jgi:hypothetical protein
MVTPSESGLKTIEAEHAGPLGAAAAMGTFKHDLFGILGTIASTTGSCLRGYPIRI